ncbi:hypothetical protein BHM03_00003649 [Ensete ventricosum]|nr:hypothetical protein BHM03_00003649 [Ensete ventricosum]
MLPSAHIAVVIVIVVAFISTRSYPLPHQSHTTPVVPSLIAISISSKKGTPALSSSSHILYHYNPLALSHITRCYLCPLATPVAHAAAATTAAQPPSSSPLYHCRRPDLDSAQPMVAKPSPLALFLLFLAAIATPRQTLFLLNRCCYCRCSHLLPLVPSEINDTAQLLVSYLLFSACHLPPLLPAATSSASFTATTHAHRHSLP